MNLRDKNIILTGASSGIGRGLLKKLVSYNTNIIAVSRDANKIPNYSKKIISFSCDISKPDEIDKLFDFAVEQLKTIDIFIANAGFAYCEELTDPNWNHNKKIYDTNVLSPIYTAEKMKNINQKNKEYLVVITCSAVHNISLPGYSLYCSTKAALHQFAKTYRYEMNSNGKILLIYPIATHTNFFSKAGGKKAPVPKPVQSVEKAADNIIQGIEKSRKSIYPSAVYPVSEVLNRILPFLYPLYEGIQYKKFKKWLKTR